MKFYTFFYLLLFALIFNGCAKSEPDAMFAQPDNVVVIDHNAFASSKGSDYTIVNAAIKGDMLEVTLNAAGCDGNSFKAVLIDAGAIMESNPVQRTIKIDLAKSEDCHAMIQKKFVFDITKLRVDGMRVVAFNLYNWNKSLLYNY